jgi:hypothetical protein
MVTIPTMRTYLIRERIASRLIAPRLQCTGPLSRSMCGMKSAGKTGRSPVFGSLQAGHGMPAPPHWHAFGCPLPHGRPGCSSQTQRVSWQVLHVIGAAPRTSPLKVGCIRLGSAPRSAATLR